MVKQRLAAGFKHYDGWYYGNQMVGWFQEINMVIIKYGNTNYGSKRY